jgi:hypothetical protein
MDRKTRRSTPPNTIMQSDADQSARFKETARKLGCDETPGALDRAFGKIATPSKQPTRS